MPVNEVVFRVVLIVAELGAVPPVHDTENAAVGEDSEDDQK